MVLLFGVACGLLYGVFFAGAVSIALPSLVAEHSALFGRLMDKPRARLLATVLLYAGILGWGLVGAVLGGVLLLTEAVAPGGGLFSPNRSYTMSVLLLVAVGGGVALVLTKRRTRLQAGFLSVVFAGVFGWLLPLLAS